MAGFQPAALVISLLLLSSAFAAVPCGNSPHQCIVGEATCVGGSCECDAAKYVEGDGYFYCQRAGENIAWLRNDPELRTFSEQKLKHPNLCRVLVAHVFQTLKSTSGITIGNSQVKVHAFQAKDKGKIYVYGFDVAALLSIQMLGTFIGRSARVYGTLQDGVPQITRQGALSFSADGPFLDVDIDYVETVTGAGITLTTDVANNREVFQVLGAGVTITFVPYDEVLRRDQLNMPGLLVKVDSSYGTTFQTAGNPVGKTPDLIYNVTGTDLTAEALALQYSYNGPVQQSQPDPSAECSDIQGFTSAECSADEYLRGSQACLWLLQQPRFMRCVDDSKNGTVVQGLFNMCIKSYCLEAAMCSQVIADISAAGCSDVRDIAELASFMTGAQCPS
ncbi:hypothetical protein PoB_005453100 [Plakobranchus ocellatus]|uniref:VWFD domain-containing protein n=1 Tax=Plakobranchus ocellatus TaxID=259542 RepID=A0AAV4C5Q2_9GAST|nr:hypothetical protein PoB_005453100 [Plakobranchus ocellatus]